MDAPEYCGITVGRRFDHLMSFPYAYARFKSFSSESETLVPVALMHSVSHELISTKTSYKRVLLIGKTLQQKANRGEQDLICRLVLNSLQ